MTPTEKLTELLNLSRSTLWTSNNTIQLAETLRAATDNDLRVALLSYAQGLARTSLTIKTCELHAAIAAQAMGERDQQGGETLQ